MIDKILSMIRKEYRMRSLDAGVYHKLVIRGMNFEINSYEATELGRVATMCATGMFGLVKRDLLIVSPLEKNAPVVTYERVKAFGKDTLLMAKYDLEKDALYLKESGKKKQSAELDAKTESFFEEYLSEVRTAEKVQP